MRRNPLEREDWARQVVLDWARGQLRRLGTPEDQDLMGKCPHCGEWRRRYQTAQAERGGAPCYVCGVCGDVLDTVPF